MSDRQRIKKRKGDLPISQNLPPMESEPEYPERIIFSPFECLLHFDDFPELHSLAQAAQREGRSGLAYPEIEQAKAQIIARGEDKETRARIIDQHLAARIDQPYGYQEQTPQQSSQAAPDLPVHPQSPSQEPEPEVRNGKLYSLSSPSEDFSICGTFQNFCSSHSAEAKKPRNSQDYSGRASVSETTGNTNITLVPPGNVHTSYPGPSFIYTAGRAQRESIPTAQSVTSIFVRKPKSQTVGPRPDSQIGVEDSFQSLSPNQSDLSKYTKPERKLYFPPYRHSNRTASDKDLIWQLEHPRLFDYSRPYREHPPLGPIKVSSLLQDPRFNYLQSSYHETERLLRPLEGKTASPVPSLVDHFHATLPRRRVGVVEDLSNQPPTNEIFAWHWQIPQ